MITMTAGTGMIMWLAELITQHGGNGMSLLILLQLFLTCQVTCGLFQIQITVFSKTIGILAIIIVLVTIAIVFG